MDMINRLIATSEMLEMLSPSGSYRPTDTFCTSLTADLESYLGMEEGLGYELYVNL
jgi:hypothetical protein